MKITHQVLLGTMLMAATAFAGPETIIKQRAKELNNQNNVRQGVAPPTTQAGQTALSARPSTAPVASPALIKFQTDLASIHANTPVTPEQRQLLIVDLLALAQSAKPSPMLAAKLANELAMAASEKPLPAASRARLAQELDALFNPGKYPQAKPEGILADVQAIFQANGQNRTRAVTIAETVKMMTREIQSGGMK